MNSLVWRLVAICCLLVWSVVLFASLAYPTGFDPNGIYNARINFYLHSSTILACFVLAFFPLQFYIYALLCCFWGLFTIVGGNNCTGMLMYLLGLFFAYKKGFFYSKKPIKIVLSAIILLVAISFQYRLGIDVLVLTIKNVLFLCMFFLLTTCLFWSSLEKIVIEHNEKKIIDLSDFDLNEEELMLLKSVITGEKYQALAARLHVSESTIKIRMATLFKKIQINSKTTFLSLFKEEQIILPDKPQDNQQ